MGKSVACYGKRRSKCRKIHGWDYRASYHDVKRCETLSDEEKQRFRSLEQIGTCPVCGSPVYEGKMNFYCSNRECLFALWKENHYLAGMKKTLDQKMAKELLEKGKTLREKSVLCKERNVFDAELVLSVEDGKAKFSLEFPKRAVSKGKRKKK